MKLNIYNAVIRSKLIYGLDSIQINESQRRELVAFQLKGLRHICKMATTYIDRANTNQEVFRVASERAGKQIIPIDENLKTRAMKLLGHLIRTGEEDPMRRVTFREGGIKMLEAGLRRVGRPRLKWLNETLRTTWKSFRDILGYQYSEYDDRNEEIRGVLQAAAGIRLF